MTREGAVIGAIAVIVRPAGTSAVVVVEGPVALVAATAAGPAPVDRVPVDRVALADPVVVVDLVVPDRVAVARADPDSAGIVAKVARAAIEVLVVRNRVKCCRTSKSCSNRSRLVWHRWRGRSS